MSAGIGYNYYKNLGNLLLWPCSCPVSTFSIFRCRQTFQWVGLFPAHARSPPSPFSFSRGHHRYVVNVNLRSDSDSHSLRISTGPVVYARCAGSPGTVKLCLMDSLSFRWRSLVLRFGFRALWGTGYNRPQLKLK